MGVLDLAVIFNMYLDVMSQFSICVTLPFLTGKDRVCFCLWDSILDETQVSSMMGYVGFVSLLHLFGIQYLAGFRWICLQDSQTKQATSNPSRRVHDKVSCHTEWKLLPQTKWTCQHLMKGRFYLSVQGHWAMVSTWLAKSGKRSSTCDSGVDKFNCIQSDTQRLIIAL